ncbi:MAG TPA: hypothetical protein VII66_08135 [Gemmatimonadaceae bacterium]
MKRSLVACMLMATTACQSYSTVALNALPDGADVQVSLTDSGSNAVASQIGSRAEQLEGKITHADSAGLTLMVSEVTRVGGATELGEGRTVSVPSDAIASVRVQSLSVTQSLLLAGVATVAAIALGRSLGGGNGTASKGGGGPPPAGH